jgi:hypothetical protein
MRIVSKTSEYATLARISRKSPALTAEIPVFEETVGGDGFDHHCAVGLAVALRSAQWTSAQSNTHAWK